MKEQRKQTILLAVFNVFSLVSGQTDSCASSPCGAGALCTSTGTGYNCACNAPSQWYNYTANACQDVNECMTNPCPLQSTCKDTQGGFLCICPGGFTWFNNGTLNTCIDVDECKAGAHNCGENSACRNLVGSFYCLCPKGYYFSNGTCLDVDECAANSPPCGGMSRCNNTRGSYSCYCNQAGYTYNPYLYDCIVTNSSACAAQPCGKAPNVCFLRNATFWYSSFPYLCSCANGSMTVATPTGGQACYNASIATTVGLISNDASTPRMCLDIMWNTRVAGNNVWQWGYNANPAQQFNLVPVGDGYYWIKDSNQIFCFAPASNSTLNGADIVLQGCDSRVNHQRWLFTRSPTEPNVFQISPRHAPGQCITVTADDLVHTGINAELQPCSRRSAGQWYRIVRQ